MLHMLMYKNVLLIQDIVILFATWYMK